MKSIRLQIFSILLVVPNIASAAGFAPNELWIFGDSYTDTRNFFISSGDTVPPSIPPFGYDDGRFSDGLMWVEHLASGLGLSVTPGFNFVGTEGNNLAVGGALTDRTNSQLPFPGSGMRSQVDWFLSHYNPDIPAGDNADSLFVVFGGANNGNLWTDISDIGLRDTIVSNAMSDIDGMVRDLHGAGAQHFLMPNLPGVVVPDDWSTATLDANIDISMAFNTALETKIDSLRTELGVTIIELDFFDLFQDLLTDMTDGITNVTEPCLDLDAARGFEGHCGNPAEYLMFDALHPSAVTHAIMGDAALAAVTAVPLPAALPLMALAVAGLGFCRPRTRAG